MRLRLVFFLLPLFLVAKEGFFSEDEDPSLFHHVNVITGDLNLCLNEGVVSGAVPLPIFRTYSSAGALEKTPNHQDLILKALHGFLIQGGWSFFSYTHLLLAPSSDPKYIRAHLAEKSGSVITYVFSHKEGKQTIFLRPEKKLGATTLNGRKNPHNNLLRLDLERGSAELFCADGGSRVYVRAHSEKVLRLTQEKLSSGHPVLYSYDEKWRLINIELKNPAQTKTFSWIRFAYLNHEPPFHFRLTTSDGKTFTYRALVHKEREYLASVESSARASEVMQYVPGRKGTGARIENVFLENTLQFSVKYVLPPDKKQEKKWAKNPEKKDFSIDKVAGLDGTLGPLATFSYKPQCTDVRDQDNLLVRYHHDTGRLTRIDTFDEHDQLRSLQKFFWDKDKLLCKAFVNGQGEALFAKSFVYDERGNVKEEVLWGDLTGTHPPPFYVDAQGLFGSGSFRKRFTYDPRFNIPLLEEEEGGLSYHYTYKPDTDLLTAKLTCANGQILVREFLDYDDDNLLISEIIDDGISFSARTIKRYVRDPASGLIQTMQEVFWDSSCGQEVLEKRTEYSYTPQKRVATETVFDGQGNFLFALHTDYDPQGRIIRKTTPLGHENFYTYDAHGKLLSSEEKKLKKIYTYNAAGWPTSCVEMDALGHIKTTESCYDNKGRLLAQTDEYGNTTRQVYDNFGNCLETHFPDTFDEEGVRYTPLVRFSYDLVGNLTSSCTPRQETTHTFYNGLRKPIRIVQPDGQETEHLYNKNATLAKTRYADGSTIEYSYDPFQRILSKKLYSQEHELLSQEFWEYNAFHLLAYTDPRGLVTTYNYDRAGRKIAEKAQERVRTFSYDTLGFLEKTTEGDTVYVHKHDPEGNILEEWTEECGKIENWTAYSYDERGRKIGAQRRTEHGIAEDFFSYDRKSRLTSHVNPEGLTTEFIYDSIENALGQKTLQKTTVDAAQNAKIEIFDATNHLVYTEKQDSGKNPVFREDFLYDRAGNRTLRKTTIFSNKRAHKIQSTRWIHDACGRICQEIDPEGKATDYTYDPCGRLKEKRLPSSKTLYFSYDACGRLTEQKSSDRSIHDEYFYQHGKDPTEIVDHVHKHKMQRTYNLFGELVEETNPYGLRMQWEYDARGRSTRLTLPDHSQITYSYQGSHLERVSRLSSEQKLQYEHKYTQFDLNGHVCEEIGLFGLGTFKTERDLLERPIKQTSPWTEHSYKYNELGLVEASSSSLFGKKHFLYDSLQQLVQENAHTYQFDSIGNPLNCTTGACNELVQTAHTNIDYDLEGNPTHKTTPTHQTHYEYDALGRLITVSTDKKRVHYSYDGFFRLLSKQTFSCINGTWTQEESRLFIYDGEREIGTVSAQGTICELKVLGLGIKGDIGGAVALEIDQAVLLPLHDLGGNIIALVTAQGNLCESYDFSAFGEETLSSSPLNPWRFSSKRHEDSLIFFGRRFYDPSLGRFLTPDPAGSKACPNLYLFVLNSPTNRLDLFGLFSENKFHPFTMDVPIHNLLEATTRTGPIAGKTRINEVELEWFIQCGHFHKLKFTQEELDTGTINLFDHFTELMPKNGSIVGLVSHQNGIWNNKSNCLKMAENMHEKIPENTLLFSFCNVTEGFFKDIARVNHEIMNRDTPVISATSQMFGAIVETINKINPELIWLHVAHSEGGLIAERAIENMTYEQQNLLKQHLYLLTLGSARPVPHDNAFRAINIYSKTDYLARWISGDPSQDPNSHIQTIPSASKWWQPSHYFDHAFHGKTYQGALNAQITDIRQQWGFYGGRDK